MKDLQEQKGGIPSKQRIYQKAAAYAIEAIETLAKAMREADNDNARVGAAKVLLSKCLPDLKASELMGESGTPIKLTFTVATEESKEQLEKLYERSDSGND